MKEAAQMSLKTADDFISGWAATTKPAQVNEVRVSSLLSDLKGTVTRLSKALEVDLVAEVDRRISTLNLLLGAAKSLKVWDTKKTESTMSVVNKTIHELLDHDATVHLPLYARKAHYIDCKLWKHIAKGELEDAMRKLDAGVLPTSNFSAEELDQVQRDGVDMILQAVLKEGYKPEDFQKFGSRLSALARIPNARDNNFERFNAFACIGRTADLPSLDAESAIAYFKTQPNSDKLAQAMRTLPASKALLASVATELKSSKSQTAAGAIVKRSADKLEKDFEDANGDGAASFAETMKDIQNMWKTLSPECLSNVDKAEVKRFNNALSQLISFSIEVQDGLWHILEGTVRPGSAPESWDMDGINNLRMDCEALDEGLNIVDSLRSKFKKVVAPSNLKDSLECVDVRLGISKLAETVRKVTGHGEVATGAEDTKLQAELSNLADFFFDVCRDAAGMDNCLKQVSAAPAVVQAVADATTDVLAKYCASMFEPVKVAATSATILAKFVGKGGWEAGVFLPAAASVEELRTWAEHETPPFQKAESLAAALHHHDDTAMLAMLKLCDRAQVEFIKLKLSVLRNPLGETLAEEFETTKGAMEELWAAGLTYKDVPANGGPEWLRTWNMKAIINSSMFVLKEMTDQLVVSWSTKVSDAISRSARIIPDGWRHWAVERPDVDRIRAKLLANGLAGKLSEQFATMQALKTNLENADVITDQKFQSVHSEAWTTMCHQVEELRLVVSVQYLCKYIYDKIPNMKDIKTKRQAIRDVKKKVRDMLVPAVLLSQLTALTTT